MAKENDLLLNQLQNPMFNAYDFKQVGLDVNNTSLEDKEVYKNLDFVKSNPLLQSDGAFDEAKFDVLYSTALNTYNQMAQNKVGEDIGSHAAFFRDNIYAPVEKRAGIGSVNYEINRVSNPLRRQTSISRIDAITDSPLSVREIAQTQRVWDSKTNSWQDSPNDGWWDNWTHTRVLAQWDEDGTHVDPVTGETVEHKKGDKKLNDAGTYYYENLNGRSVYGREVLSKFDTLTTDGSAWNKFDVFDSDDKKKSLGGNLIKNAIKIVPAFIPVVSPWYLGMRVGINVAGLLGTLGNVVTGNNSDFFHGLEGYTQSLKTSQSDWVTGGIAGTEAVAPAHAWALESMVNMAADVFTQLAEQRWLFKYPVKWIKGEEMAKIAMGEESSAAWVQAKKAERMKEFESLMKVEDLTPEQLSKIAFYQNADVGLAKGIVQRGREAMALSWAESQLKNAIDDYQKVGKLISMSYMTGVTVQDSYGQALQEGATPVEAALLALGYAVGEYKLINSDLGRWILPELSQERNTWQQIMKVKASQGLSDEVLKSTDKVAKGKFVNNMFKLGSQGALWQFMRRSGKNDFTQAAKMTVRAAISNALGEGVEETSEELLYDMAKALANVGYALSGKQTRLSAFDGGDLNSIFNRYALSFVGGTIGGGLGEALPEYRAANRLNQMSLDDANNQLIQIVKEGKADEFVKTINSVTWAPTDVGFDMDADGNFKPVKDKKQSQDAIIKQNMVAQVNIIQELLNAEGAALADEDVMRKIVGGGDPAKELRFANLSNSLTATKYLESYNQVLSDLVRDELELSGLMKTDTDNKEKKEEDLRKREETIAVLQTRIEQEKQKVQEFLEGKQSLNFIKTAVFETTLPLISSFQNTTRLNFIEGMYHKKINELSENELKAGEEAWEKQHNLKGADLIAGYFNAFEDANIKATQFIRDFATKHFDRNTAVGLFSTLLNQDVVMAQQGGENVTPEESLMAHAKSTFGGDTSFTFATNPSVLFARTLIARAEALGIDVSDETVRLMQIEEAVQSGAMNPTTAAHRVDDVLITQDGKSGLLANKELANDLLNTIQTAPFIKQNARDTIIGILDRFDEDNYPLETIANLKIAISRNKFRSPAAEFLDKFWITTKVTPEQPNITELLEFLHTQANEAGRSGNFEQFGYGEDTEEKISNALLVIDMAKAVVNAARTDNSKFGDAYGYNKMVNGLDSNSDLAEIDSNTADTIVEEISEIEQQLIYYKGLADVISGNKLTEHARTNVQVGTLLYKTIIDKFIKPDTFPPDDWNRDSIDKLKDTLSEASGEFSLLRDLKTELESFADPTSSVRALTDNEQLEFQREMKLVENALYEFFQANADNLNNVEKLAKFLSVGEVWRSDLKDTSILTKSSQNLSDSATIWWLASIAAGDPEAFHKAYEKSWDSEAGIAPIIGQELATRLAISALTNGKVFAQFAKAQNLAMHKYIERHADDEEIKSKYYNADGTINEGTINDSEVSIDFLRTILIDGIAGSGKSKGVLKQIHNIIMQDDKLKNELFMREGKLGVWVVSTSVDKAYELAVDTFGEETAKKMKEQNLLFSHDRLMQTVSGTNADGKTWNETTDENGNVVIDPSTIEADENGVRRYNFGINKTSPKPSLIITDEVSHLSLPSLKLVDEFAEYAGIHHLTFGDFDQSGVSAKFSLDDKGNLVPFEINTPSYEAYAYNTNFIRSFKLGQSLRTEHRIKDANNAKGRALVAYLKGLKDVDNENDGRQISLQYTLDDQLNLTGDKFFDYEDEKNPVDTLKAQIKHLLDVTKETPGAKLGYIYDTDGNDETSKIMDEFSKDPNYSGLIDFKKGSAAQGDENPYYVVNITKDFGAIPTASLLYTAMTRAKVGTIIIANNTTRTYIEQQTKEKSLQPSALKSSITKKAISDFIEKKRAVYQELYKEDKPIVFNRYTTSKTSPTVAPNSKVDDVDPPSGQPGKGLVLTDDAGNKYKVIQYNKDEKGVYTAILENVDTGERTTVDMDALSKLKKISEQPDQGEHSTNEHITGVGDVDNSNPNETQSEHHSFNMDETGMIERRDGGKVYYEFDPSIKGRLDSVKGVINLLQKLGYTDEHVDVTNFDFSKSYEADSEAGEFLDKCVYMTRMLRSIGKYRKSEEDIRRGIEFALNKAFGFDEVGNALDRVVFRFGLKISQDFNHDGSRHSKFARVAKERVKHLIRHGAIDDNPLIDNYLTMVAIDEDGKELFEIPIYCDTNPVTLAFSKGFDVRVGGKASISEWVAKERKKIHDSGKRGKEAYGEMINRLVSALTTGELKDHPQAKKLLQEINFYRSNTVPVDGKMLFLTSTVNGDEEWLLPGRDWNNTGIIANNDPTITAMDISGTFAHYEGEWLTYNDLVARGNIVASRQLFMSDTEVSITKNGRTIKLQPGKPFIVVSDDLLNDFTNPETALKALMNPDDISTTFVYTEPSTEPIFAWIQQMNVREGRKASEGVLRTDIGNYATAYRLLSYLVSTEEGRKWVHDRYEQLYGHTNPTPGSRKDADLLTNELVEILKRFDNIDKSNSGKGDYNQLVLALQQTLEQDGKKSPSQFPAIASVGAFADKRNNYARIFERTIRALVLGTAPDFSEKGLHFAEPVESDANIQRFVQLVTTAPNSKFKDGKVHCHVEFRAGGAGNHIVKGNTFIEVASKTNINNALDPTRSDVWVDAKLDTGIGKTMGQAALDYTKAKEDLAKYDGKTQESRKTRTQAHTSAYKKGDLSKIAVSKPGDTTSRKPGRKQTKEAKINEVLEAFKKRSEQSMFFKGSAEAVLREKLGALEEEKITPEALVATIAEVTDSEEVLALAVNDSKNDAWCLFTEKDLQEHFSDPNLTIISADEAGKSMEVHTNSGDYTINLVWKDNTVNIAKVLKPTSKSSSSSSVTGGVLKAEIGGETVEVQPSNTINDIIPKAQTLKLLERSSSAIANESTLANVIANTFNMDAFVDSSTIVAVQNAINVLLQTHPEIAPDGTNITVQNLIEVLTQFKDIINPNALEFIRLGKDALSAEEYALTELVGALSQTVLNTDSDTNPENNEDACALPIITPF